MKSGIKIISIEGAEVLKNNIDNQIIDKEYKAVFTDSLLLDKLKDLGLSVAKNESTQDIIALNFNYGYTPKEVDYIKEEITYAKGNITNIKEEIAKAKIAKKNIHTREGKKPYQLKIEELNDNIAAIKNNIKKLQQQIKDANMSADEVRNTIYNKGFHLDFYKKDRITKEYKISETIQYRFWFRTPSKSRVGDVIFINKELYNNIINWQCMGLVLPITDAKMVEFEAYKSLTASHIIGKVIINPSTEMLVVNDLYSFYETMCARVYTDSNGECKVKNDKMKVKNTLWDGMALLDNKLFADIDNNAGMMLLRQHFFKACGFRTYIQKFYQDFCTNNKYDYNTYTVKDRYGRNVFVKNIKCITTENAMKWEKFTDIGASFDYWCKKVNEDDNIFGVCKTDHNSKYGDYQRMSYQMINTLPIDSVQSIGLCTDTVNYVNNLKADNKLYLDFLQRTKSDVNNHAMMIDLYNNNEEFANSELFRTYKTRVISEYKQTLRAGKLLAEGDNLTVCGNPYVLLLHSVGQVPYDVINGNYTLTEGYNDITLPIANEGDNQHISVYTKRFSDGTELASFRNPHNSPNNIGYNVNYIHPKMEEYFNFSKNIMAVNMIQTEEQDLKNGLDEDSDFCYVTNCQTVVEASKKCFRVFPCIVNDIPKLGDNKYNNNMDSMATIDNNLAEAKSAIGISSNTAQLAMSWYWKNPSQQLADIVAIMSVLAQVSIDNAKRSYEVDLNREIARIRKLPCMQVKKKVDGKEYVAKPYFWQFVSDLSEDNKIKRTDNMNVKMDKIKKANEKKEKRKAAILRNCLEEKICPMDFIQVAIDGISNNWNNDSYTKNEDFIRKIDGKAEDKQAKKIIDAITKLDNRVKEHNDLVAKEIEKNDENWEAEQQIITQDTLDVVGKYSINQKTMQMLILYALGKEKKLKLKLLNCLYNSSKSNKKTFLSVFTSA